LVRVVVVTGRPGVGKTTVFLHVTDSLRALGMGLGGFVSSEVRVRGDRVGFQIVDLNSNRKGWLAHVDQENGPKVGKYRVNTRDLVEIGVESIKTSIREGSIDVIAIDEIGPMELTSLEFVRAIRDAVNSEKTILVTVHYREKDRILSMFNLNGSGELFEVTPENRETIQKDIVDAVVGQFRDTAHVQV
jgi:nucleoside-triphosphatase